ncbi:MAG TPA: hypothetical protein ENL21_02360 [Caldithrix abyssi]|uniref:Uncharacterized protein n=1 Tax=Caldithrix abyssi TaxID=187145 RepID=A0A7V5LIN0_CALAY|nr:hypothetical protein [Caldithrix abyssi]
MRFVSIFKISGWLLLILFFVACADLERDNPLDPKNPDSYSQTVPLVEAFVNLAHPTPFNAWAIQSLNALSQQFLGKINIVEYHRDLQIDSVFYDDPFNETNQQSFFLQLQNKYVQLWPDVPRALPDVFLNGALARFSGAYDANSLKTQMESAVSELIAQKNDYILEIEKSKENGIVRVTCRVARLGNESAENLRLRVLFVKQAQFENLNLNYVVQMSWPGILINKLKAGSYQSIDGGQIAENRADGVICAIVSEDEQQVFQSQYEKF